MHRSMHWLIFVMMLSLPITGCSGVRMPEGAPTGSAPVAAPMATNTLQTSVFMATPTIDICSSLETKKPEIEKIALIMGEFDDTSFLVQSIPDSGQMVQVILVLQRIRRDAINNKPPVCLNALKEAQVNFMSGVILTSISMMSKAKQDVIKEQLTQTRNMRTEFDKELANQLGLKYITSTPVPTIPPTPIPPTSTTAPVTATTIQDIYVVQGPSLSSPPIGTFLKGQITNAMGRTQKSDWIQIEVPGNPGYAGWVPKELIKLSTAEGYLPIVTIPSTETPTPAQ